MPNAPASLLTIEHIEVTSGIGDRNARWDERNEERERERANAALCVPRALRTSCSERVFRLGPPR